MESARSIFDALRVASDAGEEATLAGALDESGALAGAAASAPRPTPAGEGGAAAATS